MLRRTAPALLSLALLTACGGGDGGSDAGGDDALSKADFVTQAEALCKEANEKLDNEPEPTAPDQISPYFDKLLTTADDTTTELEELAADQPDKDELDRIFLEPLRGQVTVLQSYLPKITEAVGKGEQGLSELAEPDLPEADTAAMKEYGFDACVETAQAE